MTESEFLKVVTGTKRAVLGAIRAHLSPDLVHAIDDVSQETYMRIYRALSSGKGPSVPDEDSLSSWAYVIARNECLRLRSREQKSKRNQDVASDLVLLQQWTQNDSQEKNLELSHLEEMIARLESPFSETLGMLLEGYSLKEIAERHRVALGTVKSRIYRGREKLREFSTENSQRKKDADIRNVDDPLDKDEVVSI